MLRFFAALLVVVNHSIIFVHERMDSGLPLWEAGSSGVDIFFVISGFVIYLTGMDQTPGQFTVRRLARIVPLYWLITAVKVALLLVAPGVALHHKFDLIYTIKSFLFIPAANDAGLIEPVHGVGWTLQFEMFFYALFVAARLVRANPLWFVTPILIVLAVASYFRGPMWPVWTVFCDVRVLGFAGGMFIARHVAGRPVPAAAAILAIVVGLLGLFAIPTTDRLISSAIPSLLLVAGVVALEPSLKWRAPQTLIFLGAASYSLYLVHPLVAPAAPVLFNKLHLHQTLPAVLTGVATAVAASLLTYLLFEKPVGAFLNRRIKAYEAGRRAKGDLSPPTPVPPDPVAYSN